MVFSSVAAYSTGKVFSSEPAAGNAEAPGRSEYPENAASEGNIDTKTKPATDSCDLQRGRRMMGVVLGTLSKFKSEATETATTEAALRRALLEQKLAEKLQREKTMLTEALAREQKEQALQCAHDFAHEIRTEIGQLRRETDLAVGNFIKTVTEPRILWKPNL
jgi:hypothetical protein